MSHKKEVQDTMKLFKLTKEEAEELVKEWRQKREIAKQRRWNAIEREWIRQ